jgi:taurine dioxygenase
MQDENNSAVAHTELMWHTDGSYYDDPLRYQAGVSLYGLKINDDCAPTWFSSGTRAANLLPPELRERLWGKQALHVVDYSEGLLDRVALRSHQKEFGPSVKKAVHPVLWSLGLGVESLYVHYLGTYRILGMDAAESEATLSQLFDLLYDADNIYEHLWQQNDLVIWNEVAFAHRRRDVRNDKPRTLRRVALGQECWPELMGEREDAYLASAGYVEH